MSKSFFALNKPNREEKDGSDEEEESSLIKTAINHESEVRHTTFFQPIVGSISTSEQLRMKKLIFRTSRGKALV